jgi:hypothetical protein
MQGFFDNVSLEQGDQIGRVFARLGVTIKIAKVDPFLGLLFPMKKLCHKFDTKMGCATLWAFF